jgi:ABC-2 type transport system permease protein
VSAILAIARRELSAFYSSSIGWVVQTGFAIIGGTYFSILLFAYWNATSQSVFNPGAADQMNANEWIIQPLFSFLGVVSVFLTPLLGMRIYSEDLKSRSIDLLLTSPVSSAEIVLGKTLGLLGIAAATLVTSLPYVAVVYYLGTPDTGTVLANILAYVLLTTSLLMVGGFFSAFTENQIVAGAVAFAFNLTNWIIGFIGSVAGEGMVKDLVDGISLLPHAEQMGKGLLHSSDIVFFVSLILFFVFATAQRVESLRWR